MDQPSLKRSASAERQMAMDGPNREAFDHRYHNRGGRHNTNEVPPPWERSTLYSDRERMPRGRDPEPPPVSYHRGEYPPSSYNGNRYNRAGPPPMHGHPPPYHHDHQYAGRPGGYHHGPPPVMPPMDNHHRNRGYNNEYRGDGFQFDIAGKIPPPYQHDHYQYQRHEQPPLPPGGMMSSMDDVKYFPIQQRGQQPPPSWGGPSQAPHDQQYPQDNLQSDINDTRFISLEKEDVLTKLVPLGDVRENLTQNIMDLAKYLSRKVYQPSFDPEDFKDATVDFRLPSKQGSSNERRTVEHNISTLSTVVVECAAFLPTKSGVLASVVAELGVHLTRLPEGLSMSDVETATAAPEVKPDPTDEGALDRRAKIDEFRLRRSLLNCLIRGIIHECVNRLDEYLLRGRIVEAKNLIRFLLELTNCHLIHPSTSLELMNQLLKMAKEGSMADPKDSIYIEALIDIVSSCLPWLSRQSCELVPEMFTECFNTLNELLSQRYTSEVCRQALSGVWSADATTTPYEDTLMRAQRGIIDLKDAASWTSKALWRIYQTGALAESLSHHETIAQHTLPPLTFSFQKLAEALEANRTTASQVALGAGVESEFQLVAEGDLGSDPQASYAAAAAEMGVGGSSFGLNGCWRPRVCLVIWDDAQLPQLLLGIRPLEIHDRWLLEELFLSVLHCFRHTPELCAEVILRIPVSHDQFEAILVEVIFNEMLRLPHSSEPLLFYVRLCDFICQKQRSIHRLIESAFTTLSHRCHLWDNQANEVLAEFLGLWLSMLPEGPQSFKPFESWSPEALRRDAHLWKDLSTELIGSDSVISLLDRQSQILHQRLPCSLKLFLCRSMERLSRVLWHGNFLSNLPPWLHAYVPEDSQFRCAFARKYEKMIKAAQQAAADSEMTTADSAEPADDEVDADDRCPLEYLLFRKLIQIRFANTQHEKLSVLQLAQVIFYRLLGKPALAQLPSGDYISRFVCPVELKNPPSDDNQMGGGFGEVIEVKPDEEAGEEVQMTGFMATVKDEDEKPVEIEGMVSDEKLTNNVDETSAVGQSNGDRIDLDNEVEKVEVDGDDKMTTIDADIQIKDEEEKPLLEMSKEQKTDHEEALSRSMSEQFIYTQQGENSGGWSLCSLAEILMRALLGQGAKTLTHSSRVLENYKKLLIWMRPSHPRTELLIPKDIEGSVENNNADSEYYAALLRSIFSFWKDGPVKCQFIVDKLTRLGIIPVEEVQVFILKRLSLNRIGDLSTQEILSHLVRESVRRLLVQEKELKLLQRQQRFESQDEKKVTELQEAASTSRCQIRSLVINNLTETCRRLAQLNSNEVGGFSAADIDDEEGGIVENEPSTNQEVEIVGNLTKHQKFIERQSIRRVLHYGRTFIQFIGLESVQFQVNQMNPKAEIAETLTALKAVQDFLYPHGISEEFSGIKKKDEEEQ